MNATALQVCGPHTSMSILRAPDQDGGLRKELHGHLPTLILREIELQYLVPPEIGRELSANLTPERLITHYFEREHSRKLIKHLKNADSVDIPDGLSGARLRQVIRSKKETLYFLEFKGKKQLSQFGKLERPEVSIQLSRKSFLRLRPHANDGTVDKLRYTKPGFIFCGPDHRVPASFQLDRVLRAGNPPRTLSVPYYRGDIELPATVNASFVRRGHSSFSELLRGCVELTALDREISKEFSFSKLARYGLPDQLHLRAQELLDAPCYYERYGTFRTDFSSLSVQL